MNGQINAANRRQEPAGRISEVLFATPAHRSAGARYVFAAIAVSIGFGLRYLASDQLADRLPFTFFVPATLLAAWYGGFGPGLFALVCGLLVGDYFFLEPHKALGALTTAGRLAIGVYTVTCLAGMGLLDLVHTTNLNIERRIERLRQESDDRQSGIGEITANALAGPAARYEEMLNLFGGFLFTTPAKRSLSSRYIVAVGAVIIGFALRYLASDETVIYRLAFMFFAPAIFFAVWYGGTGPGLVALVGGLLLANYFFQPPHIAPVPVTGVGRMAASAYALICLIWIALLELLHATNRKLERELERLRR